MSEQKLPQSPEKAVQHIIKLVDKLTDVMEREGKALALGDSMTFTALQSDKDKFSAEYQAAAAEFKTRAQDFLDVNRSLLDQLDQKQRALAVKTQENSEAMKILRARLEKEVRIQDPASEKA